MSPTGPALIPGEDRRIIAASIERRVFFIGQHQPYRIHAISQLICERVSDIIKVDHCALER